MPLIPDLNPNIPGRVTPVAPDVGTAMAPGIAMAKVGAGIADAGEVAGRIQLRYQAARDQDAKNMARMWAQEAYSKNLAYRAENPDETTWKANLDENLGELRARVQELKLSPFAREELTAELDGWASESNSKLMLESVNHRIARGRSTYQALDEQYRKAGDNESRLRLLDENTGTLYHPEEAAVMRRQIEQDREEWEKKSRQTAAELEIMRDPTSPLLAQKYASTQPPEGADEAEYQDARQFWLQARTQAQHRFINDIRDRIATNDPDKKIRTPDELKIYEDEIGADAVAALQDGMKKSRDAAYKEWSALPENQALLVGQITAQLESLKDDDLVARVILEQQLDAVAEGPSKNYLREEIARKIRGEAPQAADTILKAGMEALKNAADLGDFGPVKPPAAKPVETRNALKAGWLKDIKKLQAQGFSESQAEDIRDAAREDAALGQKKFTELWKERPQQSANAAPFDVAVADAIRGENATLQWDADIPPEEREAHERAARTYGQAVQEFQAWAARHPKASETDMNAKLRDLGSRAGRIAPAATVKPLPARRDPSTSMNQPGVNPNVGPLWKTVSTKYPSVENWGIWGDEKHKARKSDHNTGDAIDIAIKDNNGPAITSLIESNAAAHNVKYMIHSGRIWKPSTGWQPYSGKDNHSGHVHVSFNRADSSLASK